MMMPGARGDDGFGVPSFFPSRPFFFQVFFGNAGLLPGQ